MQVQLLSLPARWWGAPGFRVIPSTWNCSEGAWPASLCHWLAWQALSAAACPHPPRCGHPSAVPGREACGCGFAFCGKAVLDEPQGPRFGKHHSSLLRCSLGCLEFAQLSRDFLSLLARCTVILSLLLIHRVLCFTCLQPLCLIPALGDPIGLQSSDPFNGCATRPVPAAGFCWPCSAVRQACRSSQGVPR